MVSIPENGKSNRKHVSVCLTPAMIDLYKLEGSIVVVIDVLRATSSMCVAFHYGVEKMIPVETVEECYAYKAQGFKIAAERNGEMIEGFDFGNSPFSYMDSSLKGKSIAITTTNGTMAIHASTKAKRVVIGSFANISALTSWLINQNENIVLFCSGWKNRINLEDSIFAGAMVKRLRPFFDLYEDTTLIAEALFKEADKHKKFYLRSSSHYQRLIHLNIQEDVKYCLREDTHPVIPAFENGALVNILKPEPVRSASS